MLFTDSLDLTSDQSIVIEQFTRGQSNNEAWLEQRKGRLTASILHEESNKMEYKLEISASETDLWSSLLGHTSA
jgi:hypothetical protein